MSKETKTKKETTTSEPTIADQFPDLHLAVVEYVQMLANGGQVEQQAQGYLKHLHKLGESRG